MEQETQLIRKVPQSTGPQRLILFHHAGGSGAQYFPSLKPWTSRLEIYCLDLPGRFFRLNESPFTDIQNLISVLKDQIGRLPTLPTYFLGHSFGALIAYELAWQFAEASSLEILGLGLSALRAPSPETLLNHRRLCALNDEELLQAIEKFTELPSLVKKEPAFLGLTLKALRNDFAIMASYQLPHAHQKLNLPSLVFGGTKDSQVSLEDLKKWHPLVETKKDPLLYEGDHFYIFKHMNEILNELL
ncbi:MAG: thioesterase II family protein [Pseudobdellovibrionaceae bacterium]